MKIATVSFVAASIFHARAADELSRIPANAWRDSQKGFSLAMLVVSQSQNGRQEDAIEIFLKNTSTTVEFVTDDGRDIGLGLYYVNGQGTRVPLQKPLTDDGFANEADPAAIQPGTVLSRKLILNQGELALVKTFPIGCSVPISHQEGGGFLKVEISPSLLAVEPPAKSH